jgi:hypothetical protein
MIFFFYYILKCIVYNNYNYNYNKRKKKKGYIYIFVVELKEDHIKSTIKRIYIYITEKKKVFN